MNAPTVSPYLTLPRRNLSDVLFKTIEAAKKPPFPNGKTYVDALALARVHANALWNDPDWMRETEDRRIDELRAFCTRLACGNKDIGLELARDAL